MIVDSGKLIIGKQEYAFRTTVNKEIIMIFIFQFSGIQQIYDWSLLSENIMVLQIVAEKYRCGRCVKRPPVKKNDLYFRNNILIKYLTQSKIYSLLFVVHRWSNNCDKIFHLDSTLYKMVNQYQSLLRF